MSFGIAEKVPSKSLQIGPQATIVLYNGSLLLQNPTECWEIGGEGTLPLRRNPRRIGISRTMLRDQRGMFRIRVHGELTMNMFMVSTGSCRANVHKTD
jgi:hypothetical protein